MSVSESERCFRIKLEFDSVPPAFPASSRYMILVKPEECKTVNDLEMLIIRKFGFSNGTIATLSLDGFCLPSSERIQLLSNDDHIKVVIVAENPQVRRRKRKNAEADDIDTHYKEICLTSKTKKFKLQPEDLKCQPVEQTKKRKSHSSPQEPEQEPNSAISGNVFDANSGKSKTRKSKKKRKRESFPESNQIKSSLKEAIKTNDSSPLDISHKSRTTSALHHNSSVLLSKLENSKKVQNGLLSSESALKHSGKPPLCTESQEFNANIKSPKGLPSKTPEKKFEIPQKLCPNIEKSESKKIDSRDKNSSSKQTVSQRTNTNKKSTDGEKSHITFESSDSSSSSDADEKNLPSISTKKTLASWLSSAKASVNQPKKTWTTINRADPGVSTNISSVYSNPDVSNDMSQETTDEANTNDALMRNHQEMLPSSWPPRVGDVIAYKILEMSNDYTPVISEYKEAKIKLVLLAQNSPNGVNSVSVEILWPKTPPVRSFGRFEMDFGEETEEETLCTDIVLEWQTLLEPKLVL